MAKSSIASASCGRSSATDTPELVQLCHPGEAIATRLVQKPALIGTVEHQQITTAEQLMRSRFEAFRAGDAAWISRTWHSSTRPSTLDLGDIPEWRGLQIVDVSKGGAADLDGVVEFRATFRQAGSGVGVHHERSRFIREDGLWWYLDGDVLTGD